MIHRFGDCELDPAAGELRRAGETIPLERQVFELLRLLVENGDRMLTREEILEKVWDGRIVSDSALSSRIKSARQAIGDDGKAQRWIRTMHGRGFRFVGEVVTGAPLVVASPHPPSSGTARQPTRPSIAVLPLASAGRSESERAFGEALADDLITELARLRWLFVIARGTSFRFRSESADVDGIGRALGVRYCLTGSVALDSPRVSVTVQLIDCAAGNIVWADRVEAGLDGIAPMRASIVSRLVAELELEIPAHEAELARLADPSSLDAWSLFHLGVQHMFRFNRGDNDKAGVLFAQAASIDPGFARAQAGLSFVHFQKAFLRYTEDPHAESALARRFAERAVELDARDPFAHFTMGRTHWLDGDLEGSRPWLERATLLSPNYAHGIYARAWTSALCGSGDDGLRNADLAMALSPLDPLHYAMAATRALSLEASGNVEDAARWGEKAARSPGAHVLISMIAAAVHELGGNGEKARSWADDVRRRRPDLTQADFFRSFPFSHAPTRARFEHALSALGM